MATTPSKNIHKLYCKSCIIPGMRCKGGGCTWAHTTEEIEPNQCRRDECRCRWREAPNRCQYIHADESKEEYARRLGFDPKHEKYDSYSHIEIGIEIERINNMINTIYDKIEGKDELRDKRLRIAIFDLTVERKFLFKKDLDFEEEERRDDYLDRRLDDMREQRWERDNTR
jgi:hypothetical protein